MSNKKLYLIRHSKSDWSYDGLPDVDRPLNERGYRDAHAMSKKLKEKHRKPDLIITSPAIRAISTALIFARTFEYPEHEIKIVTHLFEAHPDFIINLIAGFQEEHHNIFLFAHNPTLTEVVNVLCENARIDDIPTTGIATLEFKSDWKATDTVHLTNFDFPKNNS